MGKLFHFVKKKHLMKKPQTKTIRLKISNFHKIRRIFYFFTKNTENLFYFVYKYLFDKKKTRNQTQTGR